MKLIVGLGNPGKKYKKTRHNAGFMVIDKLAQELGAENWKFSNKGNLLYCWHDGQEDKNELIKPQTFMNHSGDALFYVRRKHSDLKMDDIYVCFDDLDLALGEYKIQLGKGPKDHNGLISIYEKLGIKDFWHVRVGVDNRDSKIERSRSKLSGKEYVLTSFVNEELAIVEDVVSKVVEDMCKSITNS